MRIDANRRRSRGYMLTEVIAITAISAAMVGMAVINAGKVIGHARSLSAVSSIAQTLAVARLAAVRKGVQVVVEISVEPPPSRRIGLRTFEDRDGNFLLAAPETILNDFLVDGSFHLWKKGASKDDGASAALFNTYAGNAALTQRIAFLPDGGIVAPQSSDSGLPTPNAGRGIYVADAAGKSFYRITFATTLLGHPRVDRWDGAKGYVPTQGNV
jgi:hypothetical protein